MAAGLQRSNVVLLALFLSIGANLFLAGWLVGGLSTRPPFGPPPPPIEHFGDQIRDSLSPDGARIMQTAFENIRERFMSRAAEIRSSRDRALDVLKTEPFSPSDYVAASKAARAEEDADRARADEEIANAIAHLSPEDRRRLAEIRQYRHPDHRKGFGPFR